MVNVSHLNYTIFLLILPIFRNLPCYQLNKLKYIHQHYNCVFKALIQNNDPFYFFEKKKKRNKNKFSIFRKLTIDLIKKL
jgi:hypothetical protein